MQHISTPEQWRPVVGHEGHYEVSDHGRVRSLPRTVADSRGHTRTYKGRVLKDGGTEYPRVNLGSVRYNVHRLVLEAFVGPRPDGMVACHYDDNPRNNHVSNLRWGSYSDNARDQVRNGGNWIANKTHCVNGHEFTPENTARREGGRRRCIACAREKSRDYEARRSAARIPTPPATHCKRGHEFTSGNTYVSTSGGRVCKECRKLHKLRYRYGVAID